MTKRYCRFTYKVYIEIMLWILLIALYRTDNNSLDSQNNNIIIYLDNKSKSKNNIIRYNRREKKIYFDNVYNQQLSKFLNNHIKALESDISEINEGVGGLIAYELSSHLFIKKDLRRRNCFSTSDRVGKFARKIMIMLSKDCDGAFSGEDIGLLFTELNNAGIAERREGNKPYTSSIDVSLPNLTQQSIRQYMTEICGAGGKLDEYLLIEENHFLNPKLKKNMIQWINEVSGCTIQCCKFQSWENQHRHNFRKRWQQEYEKKIFSPDIRDVFNILTTKNIVETELSLCFYLYTFLRNIHQNKKLLNLGPCPMQNSKCKT